MSEPRKIGRPTKYKPEYCDTVVECGEQGMGRYETAAVLGVTLETMANWEKAHPSFLRATTHARHMAQAWWEKQGRLGITNREFNAPAYKLQVMNRFPRDWRDRRQYEHSGIDEKPIEHSITVTRRVVDPKSEAE